MDPTNVLCVATQAKKLAWLTKERVSERSSLFAFLEGEDWDGVTKPPRGGGGWIRGINDVVCIGVVCIGQSECVGSNLRLHADENDHHDDGEEQTESVQAECQIGPLRLQGE